MKLKTNSFLCKVLRVNGITLYPYVFVKEKKPTQILLNHEEIHLAQVKRVGIFRFYYLYLKEYFQNRFKGMNHHQAYMEISFEKEAYRFQDDPSELFSNNFY